MQKAEERRAEAEAAKLEAEGAKHIAQASRLELEAAIKARSAAESVAARNRLQTEAARAELAGALEQARGLRLRAAETQKQADTEQAASVSLNRQAEAERRSASSSNLEVDRLRKRDGPAIDTAGIMNALQRYQAAYRNFDVNALAASVPEGPDRAEETPQAVEGSLSAVPTCRCRLFRYVRAPTIRSSSRRKARISAGRKRRACRRRFPCERTSTLRKTEAVDGSSRIRRLPPAGRRSAVEPHDLRRGSNCRRLFLGACFLCEIAQGNFTVCQISWSVSFLPHGSITS